MINIHILQSYLKANIISHSLLQDIIMGQWKYNLVFLSKRKTFQPSQALLMLNKKVTQTTIIYIIQGKSASKHLIGHISVSVI